MTSYAQGMRWCMAADRACGQPEAFPLPWGDAGHAMIVFTVFELAREAGHSIEAATAIAVRAGQAANI